MAPVKDFLYSLSVFLICRLYEPDYARYCAASPSAESNSDIAFLYRYRLWNFPSLDKEGWRAAPGWFETVIPQLREERYRTWYSDFSLSRTD
jgi:hypothetical protein